MWRAVRALPFRAASLGLLALTLVAIVLGQSATPGRRVVSPSSVSIFEGESLGLGASGTWLLDGSGRGSLRPLALADGNRLAKASVSPWTDEGGRRQVIGLGWCVEGGSTCTDFALVRRGFPDGEILTSVPLGTGSPPVGPPCWRPGTLAQVVYSGMDHRLYRLAFEQGFGDRVEEVSDPRPQRLLWRSSDEGLARSLVTDPDWPSDPRLGGRLFAAVRPRSGPRSYRENWEIWWLRLDESGTAIIDAGPLARGELRPPVELARHPSVVKDSAGRLMLAFVGGAKGRRCDRLCVVPLQVDPVSGDPWFNGSSVRVLAGDCLAVAPLGSSDGHGITALLRGEGEALARSFPLADVSELAGR
jgi:hypothetical protein